MLVNSSSLPGILGSKHIFDKIGYIEFFLYKDTSPLSKLVWSNYSISFEPSPYNITFVLIFFKNSGWVGLSDVNLC